MWPEAGLYKTQELVNELNGALSSMAFFPEGGLLGFPCNYLYMCEDEIPKEVKIDRCGGARLLGLKGSDALLAATFAKLGLQTFVER